MKKIINIIVCRVLVLGTLMVSVPATANSILTDMPSSAFQSTSAMDGSGSAYSSNPTLDEDGTAGTPSGNPANAPSAPRKALGLPDLPEPTDDGNLPVGDAMLPLLLMAVAFAGGMYLRRRKTMVD